jgi:hypothetical protein
LAGAGEGLAAVRAGVDFVALLLEGERHQVANGFLIVDEKDDAGSAEWERRRDGEMTLLLPAQVGRTACGALVGFG